MYQGSNNFWRGIINLHRGRNDVQRGINNFLQGTVDVQEGTNDFLAGHGGDALGHLRRTAGPVVARVSGLIFRVPSGPLTAFFCVRA
jgi:hypothetical protein